MKKDYIKHIFSLLLFGCNGIVASNIELSSYEIVLWRTLLGSLFLITLFLVTGNKLTILENKKDFCFIAMSGIAMGASWMFLYEAYAQIGVSIGTLVYYCGPVIVMVLSPVVFREKLTSEKIIGFIIVLVGLFLINGQLTGDDVNVWGLFCGIMSAVTYAFMVMFNKKSAIKGMENSMIQLIVSFVFVLIFVGIKTGCHMEINSSDWGWIILLGAFNTGVGCYLYFSSIGQLPVQSVSVLGYLEPLSAVILSFAILGEKMSFIQFIGAVLIIGGALFAEYAYRKNRKYQFHDRNSH